MKLKEEKDLEILEYDKDMDQNQLERYCKEVDFVYHLAGINRTDDEEEFIQGNAGFTLDLLELLSKYNKDVPLCLPPYRPHMKIVMEKQKGSRRTGLKLFNY